MMSFLSDSDGQKDWGFEHLGQLQSSRLVDIVKNTDTDHRDDEYGLVFRLNDGTISTAWILRDPEGNGAGHLDIVTTKKGAK